MMIDETRNIIAVRLCRYHRPRESMVAHPGSDEKERERISEALLCPDCWDSDGSALQRFMDSVGVTADDQALVKARVAEKRGEVD